MPIALAVTLLLAAAAVGLRIGADFAESSVRDELVAQQITFPPAATLVADGREDLAGYGGEVVDNGVEAKAFAGYIDGQLAEIGGGKTYAELGGPERAAFEALDEARASGAPADEIAELEAAWRPLKGQRDTVFQGQMLRGSLLNAYAWSTVGRITGVAASAVLAAAVLAAVATAGPIVRRRRG